MRETPSYRAPRVDGAWLCEPAPNQSPSLIDANRRLLNSGSVQWMGGSLTELRQLARNDLLNAARSYSEAIPASSFPFDGKSDDLSLTPIVMSGHQPELFHAGVWFKNFLLSDLARRNNGVAINVLVDHDLAKRTNLEVPSRLNGGRLGKEVIDLGKQWDGIPWEFAFLDDVDAWERFVESVVEHLNSVGIQKPLLSEMNPLIRNAILGKRPIGEGFSAARHHLELVAGLSTIEVPFSKLTDCFAWRSFLGEFLHRAEEVFDSLNRAREQFRTVRKISNPTQPIPSLRRNGSWIEIPFWTYSQENPKRRPLWVRQESSGIELSDTEISLATLPSNFSLDVLTGELARLAEAGIQIRPRALTTTMFLRMTMCDLFIHGIGGGLYDQLTNQIIRDLWTTDCPSFVVATATSHLPFENLQTGPSSIQESIHRLRDWRFTPERTIVPQPDDASGMALLETKRKLLDNIPSGESKMGWHQQIARLNEAIRQHFASEGMRIMQYHENAIQSDRERSITTNREFSFALHPKELVDKLRSLVSSDHGKALNY